MESLWIVRDSGRRIKNGFIKGVQRYKCKDCNYQYTRLEPRGRSLQTKLLAITLYLHGLSINAIAKIFGVSPPGVLDWIRRYAKKHYKKLEPEGNNALILELDEMWHYLKKKKKNMDLESLGKSWIVLQENSWSGSAVVAVAPH